MAKPAETNFLNAPSLAAFAVAALAVTAMPATAYTGKTLFTFCSKKGCQNGSNSEGLAMDPAGNLFGVALAGGKKGKGVVYEFVSGTGQYSVLYNFGTFKNGLQPGRVNLVIDVNGNLYGTTAKGGNKQGGGVVFELMHTDAGWQEIVLYDFCSKAECSDGRFPLDGLTYAGASAGQLYDGASPLFGTTSGGGTGGVVFSLVPSGGDNKWTEQVLYNFCSQANCADGTQPDTPLYIEGKGNLYGTTPTGGQNNSGVVFELSGSGSSYSESVLYSFCALQSCADGAEPLGGVVMDGSGNLYGATAGGGAGIGSGYGVLFELSFDGSQWQFSNLADFDGTNGAVPFGPLLIDSGGNLVGTTAGGGNKNNGGVVFEFSAGLHNLYNLCSGKKCHNGSAPRAGVVQDAAGNFYGVTSEGGVFNGGAIFEVSP